MTAAVLILDELSRIGVRIRAIDGGKLGLAPRDRLMPEILERVRSHKVELFAALTADRIAALDAQRNARDKAAGRGFDYKANGELPSWPRDSKSNSLSPVFPESIRSKIEAIEDEARALGWTSELLWSSQFWGSPRGLAAVLDDSDVIAEVTPDFIAIVKTERSIQRFQRRAS